MAETEADEIALERVLTRQDQIPNTHNQAISNELAISQSNFVTNPSPNSSSRPISDIPTLPNVNSGFPDLRNIQTNRTTTSNKPYSAFSDGQKWFIVIFSALGAIFS